METASNSTLALIFVIITFKGLVHTRLNSRAKILADPIIEC